MVNKLNQTTADNSSLSSNPRLELATSSYDLLNLPVGQPSTSFLWATVLHYILTYYFFAVQYCSWEEHFKLHCKLRFPVGIAVVYYTVLLLKSTVPCLQACTIFRVLENSLFYALRPCAHRNIGYFMNHSLFTEVANIFGKIYLNWNILRTIGDDSVFRR